MLALALGYFLCYIPFAALTKALSSGLAGGVDPDVGGLVLLPAASIGVLAGAIAFLVVTGWWRYISLRPRGEGMVRFPSRTMIVAGCFMALIIGTTILNFTFVGVSILFMLLMMRAGTLMLAPVVDLVRSRRIARYAWVGLALSLVAIGVALIGVDGYTLTLGAVLSLCIYLFGYAGRFRIMSRVAKHGDTPVDRRYFAEEQIVAAVALFALCVVGALIGAGDEMQALRDGFTEVLFSSDVLPALGIGLFYSTLYVFGTLIYLDSREYTWAVPINRASSVFSVLVASYGLTWIYDIDPPQESALIAAAIVLLAIAALSWPSLRELAKRGPRPQPMPTRVVLFVCSGNRGRSPIAAAIARAELRNAGKERYGPLSVVSAGVKVGVAGVGPHSVAAESAKELGLALDLHGAEPLTRELCERADVIYCMTEEQLQSVLELAPGVAGRVFCIDPAGPFPEPALDSPEAWRQAASRLSELIPRRLAELADFSPAVQPV